MFGLIIAIDGNKQLSLEEIEFTKIIISFLLSHHSGNKLYLYGFLFLTSFLLLRLGIIKQRV